MIGCPFERLGFVFPAMDITDHMRRELSLPDEGRLVSLHNRIARFPRPSNREIRGRHLLNVPMSSACARMCPSVSLSTCSLVAPGRSPIVVSSA